MTQIWWYETYQLLVDELDITGGSGVETRPFEIVFFFAFFTQK